MADPYRMPYFDCLILGYTGAVGQELLHELIKSDKVNRIVCLGRKQPPIDHHKMVYVAADMNKLTEHLDAFAGISRVYCCLGTTIKQAGSQDAFKRVDYNMVVDAAHIAKQAGVGHFSVVSAMGANETSKVFYNRVKGESEKALQQIGFKRLSIFRPSLLTGSRKDFRLGEKIAQIIFPLVEWMLIGSFKHFRSISTNTVARAMLLNSIKTDEGIEIFLSDDIKVLSKAL